MPTIIIPGFSLRNRDWAEQTRLELEAKNQPQIHYWQHWETGNAADFEAKTEVAILLKETAGQEINLVAKSIGTYIACLALPHLAKRVGKIILCGLPLGDLGPEEEQAYRHLSGLPADRILCLQNEDDPHGGFREVQTLMGQINPQIKVEPKPRQDHEYPFYPEFAKFLSSIK